MATDLPKLDDATIQQNLTELADWQLEGKMIVKEVVLGNFSAAAAFISQIAPLADSMNHHPDVLLHKFKRVKIMLWTHSQDGLTQNDFDLAQQIDQIRM